MTKTEMARLRRLHRPGKGKHMKVENLQAFLLKVLEIGPKELEEQFRVSHGVAVRARKKLQKLGLDSREIPLQKSNVTLMEYSLKWLCYVMFLCFWRKTRWFCTVNRLFTKHNYPNKSHLPI